MSCSMMPFSHLLFFSWSSSLSVLSPSSLILDLKACKQTSWKCVRHKQKCCHWLKCMMEIYCAICANLSQGGTHLQEVGGTPDPRPELHWPSSVLFPLVAALAGGERLLPDVYEPRQRQNQLCAAVWPRVQSESGPCLHRHQIWSLHWELHSVGQLCVCLRTESSSILHVFMPGVMSCLWFMRGLFVVSSGVWSSNAAAIDRLIGGVMKSTGWQKPVTFSKCNASRDLLHLGRTRSLNGQICSLPEIYNYLSSDFILIC